MKNAFYFSENATFVLETFKFLYFLPPLLFVLSAIAEMFGESDWR